MARANRLLALDALAEAAEAESPEVLAKGHREWIEEALRSGGHQRDEAWTKSLAVGSEQFVLKVQENLGVRGKGRGVFATGDAYVLRESPEAYKANFDPENRAIAPNIGLLGKISIGCLGSTPTPATHEGQEWMWVEITAWQGNKIKGLLKNEPSYIPSLHGGQIVEVNQEDIFD